jgi:V-type H+-transporting ATPase subunit a
MVRIMGSCVLLGAMDANISVTAHHAHVAQSKLEDLERETLEHNSNSERLQRTHSELAELQILLEKAGQFFHSANQLAAREAVSMPATTDTTPQDMGAPLLGADRETGQVSSDARLMQA